MHANLGQTVLRHIRTLFAGPQAEGQTDGDLLDQFIHQRSDAAFTALLEHHGPMVLSVCRRVLRDEHLAEDVFQATSLVLAQGRLDSQTRGPGKLAPWRGLSSGPQAPRPDPPQGAIDESRTFAGRRRAGRNSRRAAGGPSYELRRLPERYRLPLVLCYLEGRTHNEAALQLGWGAGNFGTCSIAAGNGRSHLVRRGVTLPVAGAATLLVDGMAPAAVPSLLAVSTVRAAVLFAAGKTLAESWYRCFRGSPC